MFHWMRFTCSDIYQAVTSSNMQYYQDGSHLYMIGGYGRMVSKIHGLLSRRSFQLIWLIFICSCLFQVLLSMFQANHWHIHGGVWWECLRKIDSTYQFVYSDIGSMDNMQELQGCGMFTQQYTKWNSPVCNTMTMEWIFSISNYTTLSDTTVFHRRDFNLVPQIFPLVNMVWRLLEVFFRKCWPPYLTPIDIIRYCCSSVRIQPKSDQYTSHCCSCLWFRIQWNAHVVFGGMSLYTWIHYFQTLVDTVVPLWIQ